MDVSTEELVVPEHLRVVMSNITNFKISGGYNIPDIKRVSDITTLSWESKFSTETEFNKFYEKYYDQYGRDGLFRYEYLNHMCACLRNYTKGGFGNEGIWLRPEDLPAPDYAGIKENYYPLPIPLELLDQYGFTYTTEHSNTNQDISRRCRCRDIPLLTNEIVYKVIIFSGNNKYNILYLREYCWERDLRVDIIDTELNKLWAKAKNPVSSGRPVVLTNMSLEQKRGRQNILNKLSQTNKRYTAAKNNNDQIAMGIALLRLRKLINELADSNLGNLPETWHWVRNETLS